MELDRDRVYDALSVVIDWIDYDVWKQLMYDEETGEEDLETFPKLVEKFIESYNEELDEDI